MRKLATIQQISEINLIPNADRIEVASVLGWKVVVEKGQFKVGDLCVYCEIDSILPEKPEYEFLRSKHFRIKTQKLRGQVSQGICFPINTLFGKINKSIVDLEIGEEVTDALEIKKHMPNIPACLTGLVKGAFPEVVCQKTDETRVQVLQDVITRYKGTKCYATEKLDGSSATYYFNKGEFGVCSRNLELKETADNAFWEFARKTKM